MRRSRIASLSCLALAACLSTPDARASTTCTVSTAGVNFGLYDPVSPVPNDTAGNVTVSCSNTPPPGNATIAYAIALSPGSSGSVAGRRLSSGNSHMPYNLYTSASYSEVWGDGSAGGALVGGALRVTGRRTLSAIHTIHGRIPARQDPAPGSYTDTIVVSLVF